MECIDVWCRLGIRVAEIERLPGKMWVRTGGLLLTRYWYHYKSTPVCVGNNSVLVAFRLGRGTRGILKAGRNKSLKK